MQQESEFIIKCRRGGRGSTPRVGCADPPELHPAALSAHISTTSIAHVPFPDTVDTHHFGGYFWLFCAILGGFRQNNPFTTTIFFSRVMSYARTCGVRANEPPLVRRLAERLRPAHDWAELHRDQLTAYIISLTNETMLRPCKTRGVHCRGADRRWRRLAAKKFSEVMYSRSTSTVYVCVYMASQRY